MRGLPLLPKRHPDVQPHPSFSQQQAGIAARLILCTHSFVVWVWHRSWGRLLPEIQGRILAHMDDEERCSVIPRLSKTLKHIHVSYPPRREVWTITRHITPSMILWLLRIAASLAALGVELDNGRPGLLHALLGIASIAVPNLQHLAIHDATGSDADGFALLASLSILTNIRTLTLCSLMFPEDVNVTELQSISRLERLEEINLTVGLRFATAEHVHSLWSNLALLPKLINVKILIYQLHGPQDQSWAFFFETISTMKQVRSLTFYHLHDHCLSGGHIPEDIGRMVNLTGLRFEMGGFKVTSAVFEPILSLPSLESLYLDIDDRSKDPNPLTLQSTRLTKLDIHFAQFGKATSVDQYLPADTPALPSLRELHMGTTNNVKCFPASVAGALKRLTSLVLDHNSFAEIPATLTAITTLRNLDMSYNKPFELHPGDIDILTNLPGLSFLDIRKGDFLTVGGVSVKSVEILKVDWGDDDEEAD